MEKNLGIGAMSGCSAMLSGSPTRAAAIPSCSYLSSGNGKNGYGQFPWSPLHFSPLPTRPIFVHWNGRGGISINPSQVKGLKCRQRCGVLVKAHLGHVPGPDELESVVRAAFHGSEALFERVEGLLYTLADAAVSTDAVVDTADKAKGDWLTGITNILEAVLKVLKDGLSSVNIPYSYGFAIILLTVLVKAVTLPLTKQQVESSLAMQNLQPKIKAIQQRYAGDQERIQLETARLYKQAGVNPLAGCLPTLATLPVWIGLYRALSNVANEGLLTEGFFWIPSLAGPTTIAARQTGSGISWLFPFVDGHPPLGWADTIAYLVLPVLLVASQYVSMQIMQPKTPDPSQQNSQVILKFLPLMIGYFSLSVPSGLSLYWFTNNLLSTGQQVWLKKLGGAKLPDSSEIIDAGQAKRTTDSKETRGERFRRLKAEETRRKAEAASKKAASQSVAGAAKELEKMSVIEQAEKDKNRDSESEDENGDGNGDDKDEAERPLSTSKGSLEELYANSGNGAAGSDESSPNKNKRSKRKRMA